MLNKLQSIAKFEEAEELLSMVIHYLEEQNKDCYCIVDQNNVITRYKFEDAANFLNKIKLKFPKIVDLCL